MEAKIEAKRTDWKLTLAYHGSGFHGWQVQPGLLTVQGALARALTEVTGVAVLPQGAGRTDAGVHALAQVASFTLPMVIPPANLQRALNHALPPAIRILRAEQVTPGFHARHSARRKQYEYRIFERRPDSSRGERLCSPFLAPFVWDCRWPLDLGSLQCAAAVLPGTRDFSAMAASRREAGQRTADSMAGGPNLVKTIYNASWQRAEGLLFFRISGSGFLHHMVRNLVGTMVEVGRGSLDLAEFTRILASGDRAQAGPTAPAGGLYLHGVEYGEPDGRQTDAFATDRFTADFFKLDLKEWPEPAKSSPAANECLKKGTPTQDVAEVLPAAIGVLAGAAR